jgi:hypothetical protein
MPQVYFADMLAHELQVLEVHRHDLVIRFIREVQDIQHHLTSTGHNPYLMNDDGLIDFAMNLKIEERYPSLMISKEIFITRMIDINDEIMNTTIALHECRRDTIDFPSEDPQNCGNCMFCVVGTLAYKSTDPVTTSNIIDEWDHKLIDFAVDYLNLKTLMVHNHNISLKTLIKKWFSPMW